MAVLAFPTPEGDTGKALVPASVKSNRADQPWEACLGGGKAVSLSPGKEAAWVETTFAEAVTLRTVEFSSIQSFNHPWCYDPGVTVTVLALLPEGPREVAKIEMPQSNWQDNRPMSVACADASAKNYRIVIDNRHGMTLNALRLFSGARQNNWEAEAAWTLRGLDRRPYPAQAKAAWVDPARIVDLTGKMDAQGTLDWEAPAGAWTVLRVGHVNTGRQNGPAPAEGTGWECDKLSASGADAHFPGYIGRLSGAKGAVGGGLLKGMLMDSWECETQTWTPGMDAQFMRLRGYPLTPWLPAVMGYTVGDPETTARFLRDWRATVNDLLVKNFFGRMAELARANGLAVSFETASGDVFPGDILEYYKCADVPMCEFWQPRSEAFVGCFDFKPVKPCASAAHVYGKPRVAAEAFTSFALTWNEHLEMLKSVANIHFAEGVTHLVFHTYTHNPRTDWLPPGTSFGAGIGTPFLRGQTWWSAMPEFTAYLSRCSYLLERGRPVSDVLWYLGDEQNHKPHQEAPFPAGYTYDYCNPDVLLNRLSVSDGCLETPEGVSYRALWLSDCPRMLPETLERLLALVKKGAVVVGEAPRGMATLSGGAKAEKRFGDAVAALWGDERKPGVRKVGKGRVISGVGLGEALRGLGIAPDLTGSGVVWAHRQAKGADWYFVAPKAAQGFRGTLEFRSTGAVELWSPRTGISASAGVLRREGERTLVALDLPASESVFVLFRKAAKDVSSVVRVERDGTPVADAHVAFTEEGGPQVVSARFGDPADVSRQKDVTAMVRADLAAGAKSIAASTEWAGGDPALGTRKRLYVTLRESDGQERKYEALEGETLSFDAPAPQPLPACEVLDGGSRLLAWEPGAYRVLDANGQAATLETRQPHRVTVNGPWTISFPSGWGAPAEVKLDALASWTELALPPEARAFSGTATYAAEFTLDAVAANARCVLDLGRVEMIGRVRVNDAEVGTVWAPPYRVDVTRAVRPGVNRLTVEVTNTWFNRLVYDAGQPEAARKTWTINGPSKDAAPQLAGLLGPVSLRVGYVLDLGKSGK